MFHFLCMCIDKVLNTHGSYVVTVVFVLVSFVLMFNSETLHTVARIVP
jgi:hypothetical protein